MRKEVEGTLRALLGRLFSLLILRERQRRRTNEVCGELIKNSSNGVIQKRLPICPLPTQSLRARSSRTLVLLLLCINTIRCRWMCRCQLIYEIYAIPLHRHYAINYRLATGSVIVVAVAGFSSDLTSIGRRA